MVFGGVFTWILAVVAMVWVIYDILTQQQKMDQTHKLLWIIAAILFSIVTAIVYYFVVKRK